MTTTPDRISRALNYWETKDYALKMARDRLVMLLDASLPESDHPGATQHVIATIEATLTQPTDPNEGREAQPGAVREALAETERLNAKGIRHCTQRELDNAAALRRKALAATPAPVEPTEAEAREVLAWRYDIPEAGVYHLYKERQTAVDGWIETPLYAFATTRPAATVERENGARELRAVIDKPDATAAELRETLSRVLDRFTPEQLAEMGFV